MFIWSESGDIGFCGSESHIMEGKTKGTTVGDKVWTTEMHGGAMTHNIKMVACLLAWLLFNKIFILALLLLFFLEFLNCFFWNFGNLLSWRIYPKSLNLRLWICMNMFNEWVRIWHLWKLYFLRCTSIIIGETSFSFKVAFSYSCFYGINK